MLLIITSLTGVFLILMGFLVKKYPDLIAGYNTMTASEKRKVDIEGLSNMMRTGLIITGTLVAISYPLLVLIELAGYGISVMSSILILGVIIILVSAQTFKKS